MKKRVFPLFITLSLFLSSCPAPAPSASNSSKVTKVETAPLDNKEEIILYNYLGPNVPIVTFKSGDGNITTYFGEKNSNNGEIEKFTQAVSEGKNSEQKFRIWFNETGKIQKIKDEKSNYVMFLTYSTKFGSPVPTKSEEYAFVVIEIYEPKGNLVSVSKQIELPKLTVKSFMISSILLSSAIKSLQLANSNLLGLLDIENREGTTVPSITGAPIIEMRKNFLKSASGLLERLNTNGLKINKENKIVGFTQHIDSPDKPPYYNLIYDTTDVSQEHSNLASKPENKIYIPQPKLPGRCEGDCENEYGTYTYESGNKYEGYWLNGNKNGFGIFTWANGDKYEGHWQDDNRNGEGTFTWANGMKYIGHWKDDKRNGKGTHYFANGDVFVSYQ